jgi:sugar O-acyltransferase (sialic acid O-acetyltransferase NeuD family)
MEITLIGAGGHARVVVDCLLSTHMEPKYYIDEKVKDFLNLKKIGEDFLFVQEGAKKSIIAFGAVTVGQAERRSSVFEKYVSAGIDFINAIHASAIISSYVSIGKGVMVSAAAIVNSGASIGDNAIINTGAMIEHDCEVGAGTHICPGAIVLGGAKIGKNCIIGAGAVVLPYSEVMPSSLVPALTRFK